VKSIEEDGPGARGKLDRPKIRGLDVSLSRKGLPGDGYLSLADVEPNQFDVEGRRLPGAREILLLVLTLGRANRGERERLPAPEVDDTPGTREHPLPEDFLVNRIDAELDARKGPWPNPGPRERSCRALEKTTLWRHAPAGWWLHP